MAKNGKLHALLAVLGAKKGAAEKIEKEARSTFGNKQHLFDGHVKTYKPMSDKDESLPDDRSPLGSTVGEKLSHFAKIFSPFVDAGLQIDETNMKARANIEVDGMKIENVPATFLMRLDGHLSTIRKVLDAIPTLDPKHEWEADKLAGKGVMKAVHDVVSNRSIDKIIPVILYEATFGEKGQALPAQIKERSESIKVGEWTLKMCSGRISSGQKYEIMARLDQLQLAVKSALSNANEIEHDKGKVAEKLFGFLFKDIPLKR